MRRGTRDASWGLLVLITATGCASAHPAETDVPAGPGSHEGYTGASHDGIWHKGIWGDDGMQAREQIQEPG
jgi:hypothetical protein